MKYRTPATPANFDLDDPGHLKSNTYKVKVITPIYGGGVKAGEPDTEMPIRASAIRGQLRYWWRFLAMNRNEVPLSGEKLFIEERKIWGGIGDENELNTTNEKDFSSKVFIKCRVTKKKNLFRYDNRAPQYALFPARQDNKNPAKQLIDAGVKFDLILSWDKSIDFNSEIKSAVRWWACFGGIGARTRRGLGAIEVTDTVSAALLKPVTQEEAKAFRCDLRSFKAKDARVAWINAVNKLYQFRQGTDIARNGKFGRSMWPEADSVRKTVGEWNPKDHHAPRESDLPLPSFPRAMFGLPINFEFKSERDNGIPPTTQLIPCQSERMSSPVILKPALDEQGYFISIALLMPSDHMDNLGLKLQYTEETLKQKNGDPIKQFAREEWWPTSEQKTTEYAQQITPMRNRDTSALTAFMNFFEKG